MLPKWIHACAFVDSQETHPCAFLGSRTQAFFVSVPAGDKMVHLPRVARCGGVLMPGEQTRFVCVQGAKCRHRKGEPTGDDPDGTNEIPADDKIEKDGANPLAAMLDLEDAAEDENAAEEAAAADALLEKLESV